MDITVRKIICLFAGIAQLGEQQTEVIFTVSGGPVFNPRSWHFYSLFSYKKFLCLSVPYSNFRVTCLYYPKVILPLVVLVVLHCVTVALHDDATGNGHRRVAIYHRCDAGLDYLLSTSSCMSPSSGSARNSRVTSQNGQTVISSYFSQSSSSSPLPKRQQVTSSPHTVDLTLDDSDSDAELWRELGETPPPAKKRKVEISTAGHSAGTSSTELVQEGSAVQQYRFGPSSQVSSQHLDDNERRRKLQWHSRAKRILLADNNVLERRLEGSTDIEEPAPSDSGDEDTDAATESRESAPIEFEELMSYYTSSSNGKRKRNQGKKTAETTESTSLSSRRAPTKKATEVGPSGKAYTPLELQVILVFSVEF